MKIDFYYLDRCIHVALNAASDIVEAKKKYDNEEEIVDLNDLDMAPDDIRHQWKAASLEIMCMFEISYAHVDYVMELVEKLIYDVYKLTNTAEKYAKDLTRLYVERGFAKRQMGDNQGAENDFLSSELKSSELNSYEPTYTNQVFVVEKF